MGYSKYEYNTSAFLNEDSISYYLLGAFLADGWIDKDRNRVCFSSTDFEWIESIRNVICPTLYIRRRKTKAKDMFVIAINNKSIHDWFVSKGFTTDKSLTIKCPDIPNEVFFDFFLGCIDGDGFISVNPRKDTTYKDPIVGISSGSKDFLDALQEKLATFGIVCKVGMKCKPTTQKIMDIDCKVINNHFYMKAYNRQALKLVCMLYKNHVPFLGRKGEMANQIIDYYHSKDHPL